MRAVSITFVLSHQPTNKMIPILAAWDYPSFATVLLVALVLLFMWAQFKFSEYVNTPSDRKAAYEASQMIEYLHQNDKKAFTRYAIVQGIYWFPTSFLMLIYVSLYATFQTLIGKPLKKGFEKWRTQFFGVILKQIKNDTLEMAKKSPAPDHPPIDVGGFRCGNPECEDYKFQRQVLDLQGYADMEGTLLRPDGKAEDQAPPNTDEEPRGDFGVPLKRADEDAAVTGDTKLPK